MHWAPTQVFAEHFAKWVELHNASSDKAVGAGALEELLAVLPRHVPARLGVGLKEGILDAYVTGEGKLRVGVANGLHDYVFAGGSATRCSERYLQLAEYVALHTLQLPHPSLAIRLEDGQMDLTVRRDGQLVAYLEIKTHARDARRLLQGLLALEGQDIACAGPSPTSDAVKKARYMIGAAPPGPLAFAVRGGDELGRIYDEARQVTVTVTGEADERRGRLKFDPLPDPLPLHVELQALEDLPRRAQACLVWTLEREAGLVPRRGKHGTYLLHRELDGRAPVVLGFEARGSVYTVFDALTAHEREAFEAILRQHDASFGSLEGQHRLWKRGGRALVLADEVEARALGTKLGSLLTRTRPPS